MTFIPFHEARDFVRKLGLKTGREWISYCKLGKKPDDIPKTPWHIYKSEWKSMGDWLGTGNVAPKNRTFRPFNLAREFVRSLNMKDYGEWRKYSKSEKKPYDIPSTPERTYSKEWKGIGDWLGTGSIATFNKKFLPFKKAREFVRSLGLKNYKEWKKFSRTDRPDDIPANPRDTYSDFKGYGDWIGTGSIGWIGWKYLTYSDARKFVHSLRLQTQSEWIKYCKSGMKPADIPSTPSRTYKNEWKGMGDWLGTNKDRKYKTFEEARAAVHILKLSNKNEWTLYCKSGKKPADIPSTPWRKYKKEWKSMGDWLGTGYVALRYRQHMSFEEAREYVRKLGLNKFLTILCYNKSSA